MVWEVYGYPMEVTRGCLYDVWDVYGTVYMMFGECMWTLGVIGALILGLGRVLGP